jgi:hypothetical protein
MKMIKTNNPTPQSPTLFFRDDINANLFGPNLPLEFFMHGL